MEIDLHSRLTLKHFRATNLQSVDFSDLSGLSRVGFPLRCGEVHWTASQHFEASNTANATASALGPIIPVGGSLGVTLIHS